MHGLGRKLRLRATELGLTGAEVARRAGLSPVRYGHYLTDIREPDLGTLARICRVLGLKSDSLLGVEQESVGQPSEIGRKQVRITELASLMDARGLDLALDVMEAIMVASNHRQSVVNKRESKPRTSRRLASSLPGPQEKS